MFSGAPAREGKAFFAGEAGAAALRIHNAALALGAVAVLLRENLQRLLRGFSFGEEFQALAAVGDVRLCLGGDGADAGLRPRHDCPYAEVFALHGHAKFPGGRIKGHDGKGGDEMLMRHVHCARHGTGRACHRTAEP